jgi:hypothetical protein
MSFRFKALARQRQRDELDTPTVLTSPRDWLALLCLAAAMIAAVVWAAYGRLPQTANVAGVIAGPDGTAQVQSLYSGMVTSVAVSAGEHVGTGQEVAAVTDAGGASHQVVSLFSGQVISLQVADGEVVGPGLTVAVVERDVPGGGQQVAMLFASPAQAAGIAPGESVGLAVASAPSAAFGLLRGQVLAVSKFPLTAAELDARFSGIVPAATLAADTGELLVTVRLERDSRTASGYSWTTQAGPPQALPLSVPVTGAIALGGQAPMSLLFGE